MRRTILRVAGAAAGIALMLGLSGCSGIGDLVGGGIQRAIKDGTGVDVNVGEGSSLPSSWPPDLPVPAGKVSVSAGNADGMTVVVTVPDRAAADAGVQAVEAAGYSLVDGRSGIGDNAFEMSTLSNGSWQVLYTAIAVGDGVTVTMVVTPQKP